MNETKTEAIRTGDRVRYAGARWDVISRQPAGPDHFEFHLRAADPSLQDPAPRPRESWERPDRARIPAGPRREIREIFHRFDMLFAERGETALHAAVVAEIDRRFARAADAIRLRTPAPLRDGAS